ncbi:IPTL-CTERM sorting domain-containing protein [Acidovorax sp. NCPPB 3576]|uniref:IPTL-CTERM sorting domain-containing protein n=1 Tax=Acidovorax sp. NCPPB 3576 TaxID=2940488 RepID=UPI00234B2F22|nr:IPTL-CTERM sorting domain-containing protein [Acidovorax sp. NCPPB 3576]WCM89827.1 IPTL-CTERM sorting domain-containing protein [Acidovorax sp. NCPPB 3576]
MRKILLGSVLALVAGTSFGATVNITSTGNYANLQNYTNCTTTPASLCANFLPTHNVTGTFSTAGALPANASNLEIGSTVTSYSFSSGLDTVASTDTNARLNTLRISTDASGNITNVNLMQAVLWVTGTAPHTTADRFTAVILAGANSTSTHNSGCQNTGTGSSGVTDTCLTSTGVDTSRSTANNAPVSYAMAAAAVTTAAPIPTVSEWGLILMASLLGMFGIARLRRQR